jgi:hypothetical protein
LNPDFHDMLSALCEEGAEFLVVGAYALAAHGYARATGDIDIRIRATPDNAERVWRSLKRFGVPLFDLTRNDLSTPEMVFQIGTAPNRIDIITSIDGVDFDSAWPNRKARSVEGLALSVLGRRELLLNKRASGRPKDLADVAWLESESDQR